MATLLCYVSPINSASIPAVGQKVSVKPHGLARHEWRSGEIIKKSDEGCAVKLDEPIDADIFSTNGRSIVKLMGDFFALDEIEFGNGTLKLSAPITIEIIQYVLAAGGDAAPLMLLKSAV